MSDAKFSKIIDYDALKREYGDSDAAQAAGYEPLNFSAPEKKAERSLLKGSRLRSYAFAVLTRKEYSKAELIEKLALYAENRDEVIELVEELATQSYQSDQRVAETVLSSQKRKGKGPARIKLALKNKKIDSSLIADEIQEIDWLTEAYQLKVKKYGVAVTKDPKIKAKQIRFLQYRGFDLDTIFKAISRHEYDD
jgi:regulatory protein